MIKLAADLAIPSVRRLPIEPLEAGGLAQFEAGEAPREVSEWSLEAQSQPEFSRCPELRSENQVRIRELLAAKSRT